MHPERLEMRWTNTFFSQDMDLSREAQQQSNEQQVAAAQPEVSLYSRHAHSLLWPEKMTNERPIGSSPACGSLPLYPWHPVKPAVHAHACPRAGLS